MKNSPDENPVPNKHAQYEEALSAIIWSRIDSLKNSIYSGAHFVDVDSLPADTKKNIELSAQKAAVQPTLNDAAPVIDLEHSIIIAEKPSPLSSRFENIVDGLAKANIASTIVTVAPPRSGFMKLQSKGESQQYIIINTRQPDFDAKIAAGVENFLEERNDVFVRNAGRTLSDYAESIKGLASDEHISDTAIAMIERIVEIAREHGQLTDVQMTKGGDVLIDAQTSHTERVGKKTVLSRQER